MLKNATMSGLTLWMVCLLAGFAQAEWASVSGTFVYGGDAPEAKLLKPSKDKQFCGKDKIPNEKLLVDPDSKGIRDIVIYVRKKPKAIHPQFAADAGDQVRIDNSQCRFEPHVLLLRTTQTLVVGNLDTIGHNSKIDTFGNAPINPIVPAGGNIKHQFKESERLPAKVSCSIHPWMSAILVIKDHPYMAVTDPDGNFTIDNLPQGEKLELQFWHEAAGYVKNIAEAPVEISKKGRTKITLTGNLNLGTMTVDPKNFK